MIKAAEAAGAAAKLADFTKTASEKLQQLIASWSTRFTEQRNLAPSAFGIDTTDVKVHAGVTVKVYETFKVADFARDQAVEYVEKAETAAEEADVLLKAGGKSAGMYQEMVAKTATLIGNKIKEYESVFVTTWGKIAIDEGARFKQETSLIKKGEPATVARALKIAEQARAALPKTIANCENMIRQANELATKERTRIPSEFQRALKPKIDQLGMLVMGLLQKHKANQVKFTKTLQALTAFEEAVEEASN
jgi:hypothetical protein